MEYPPGTGDVIDYSCKEYICNGSILSTWADMCNGVISELSEIQKFASLNELKWRE